MEGSHGVGEDGDSAPVNILALSQVALTLQGVLNHQAADALGVLKGGRLIVESSVRCAGRIALVFARRVVGEDDCTGRGVKEASVNLVPACLVAAVTGN